MLEKRNSLFFRIRFEALVNLYLNQTGWVPAFFGVVPLKRSDVASLGLVQEYFAQEQTLKEVLDQRLLTGGLAARVKLALTLATALSDVHALHVLVNNFKVDNILCACSEDGHDCSDIKVIDLTEVTGCEGKTYSDNLAEFGFLAPEVRKHHRTSFASDAYSLCVAIGAVMDDAASAEDEDEASSAGRDAQVPVSAGKKSNVITLNADEPGANTVVVLSASSQQAATGKKSRVNSTSAKQQHAATFLSRWATLQKQCLSADTGERPSAYQLQHFFKAFLQSIVS